MLICVDKESDEMCSIKPQTLRSGLLIISLEEEMATHFVGLPLDEGALPHYILVPQPYNTLGQIIVVGTVLCIPGFIPGFYARAVPIPTP